MDNVPATRDTAAGQPRDIEPEAAGQTAGQPRDISGDLGGRGTTTTDRESASSRGLDPPPRDIEIHNEPRDIEPRDNGSYEPRDKFNDWEDPKEVVERRAYLNGLRGAARDWSAIDACGMCDRNGFVVIEQSDAIPTVAFCSHMTTLAAPRRDLA